MVWSGYEQVAGLLGSTQGGLENVGVGGAGGQGLGELPPYPEMLPQCKLSGNSVAVAMVALPSPGNPQIPWERGQKGGTL